MQHLMDCGNILSGGCVEISDKTFHFLSLFQQIRVFSTFLPYRPIFLYYQEDLILELVEYK